MAVEKSVASGSLVEVVDRVLDKGVVIDAFVRVSLVYRTRIRRST